ncbi:MAG TPA: HAMP domain-containing sensor histidine kinase [Bacteriovoracaceae bacterium]|nr:HAMP domain-containing sensor histidine kinase [Bacteriovoracaceae bacterium]
MENRPDSPNKALTQKIALHLDNDVLTILNEASIPLEDFTLLPQPESRQSIIKINSTFRVTYANGEICDFPWYVNNVALALDGFRSGRDRKEMDNEPFESIFKTTQSIEKRMFSNVHMTQGLHVKDLWDEIIKKINSISNESHSLGSLVEKLLEVPFLQNFESSLIILHLKGQTKASVLGTLWRGEKHQGLLEVKEFNLFFNSVKKAKIKSFSTDTFPLVNLPFNGSFLAKEVISKKYSMVAIASRNDFLSCGKDEIELYETCIDLLQPHFERLVDQEFSDKRVSELRVCLKDFPLPLRIKDSSTGAAFLNDLYESELQDKDIFFSKKARGTFTLDLYDSDELRHYAFDLFHFQRISLLGELLNTLRHELSNPLFGLKLGAQIFGSLEVANDNKELMREIEKNVNRCQVIIENFSNLYQFQSEVKPVSIKRIIDEALVLSKSEARSMRFAAEYSGVTQDQLLDVPMIFVVQIIFNLIVNASQAARQNGSGGEIKISVGSGEKCLFVDVQDNGPGIPPELISSLFKPFFTTKIQGTGLGLVLSRNLALKMGGNLEYLVNNSHKGAHFRLTLPTT